MILQCELAILRDMRIHIDILVQMEEQRRNDIMRRQQDGEPIEPGPLTCHGMPQPQPPIDMLAYACDPNGVHVEDSQT